MDKQSLISSISQSQEDTLFLAKIYDKLSTGERRNIPSFTSFLTGREQRMAKELSIAPDCRKCSCLAASPGPSGR